MLKNRNRWFLKNYFKLKVNKNNNTYEILNGDILDNGDISQIIYIKYQK
jgi:hypothetical protein